MKRILHHIPFFLAVFGVLLVASYFRFTGINWDQNQHLHPDERFITMVTESMRWPKSFHQYFTTSISPVNPHNNGYSFFVYGLWPILLTKIIAQITSLHTYDGITLVGRYTAGVFDSLTVLIVMYIAYRLAEKSQKKIASLLAGLSYATMALPIGLAHYYAVDPFLTFSTTLLLLFLVSGWIGIPAGIAFGLAISAKISAGLLFPMIIAAYWITITTTHRQQKIKSLIYALEMGIACALIVRILYPYIFDASGIFPTGWNMNLLANFKSLSALNDPNSYFPPGVQWIGTTPYIYPFLQMACIGIGGIHTLALIFSFLSLFMRKISWRQMILPIIGILSIFGYQGIQYVKALRYFAPIYPMIAVIMGMGIAALVHTMKHFPMRIGTVCIFCIVVCIWPCMTLSVYRRQHTRIQASEYIYSTIPPGSVLTSESWDDGLPLPLPNKNFGSYRIVELPITGKDTLEKWATIQSNLQQADYIILSSNRGYGSMTQNPLMFPKTTQWYKRLFDGSLGFIKVAEFTSRPHLEIPGISLCVDLPWFSYGRISSAPCQDSGISIIDDYVDETWTVYDHPKVTIFKHMPHSIPSLE